MSGSWNRSVENDIAGAAGRAVADVGDADRSVVCDSDAGRVFAGVGQDRQLSAVRAQLDDSRIAGVGDVYVPFGVGGNTLRLVPGARAGLERTGRLAIIFTPALEDFVVSGVGDPDGRAAVGVNSRQSPTQRYLARPGERCDFRTPIDQRGGRRGIASARGQRRGGRIRRSGAVRKKRSGGYARYKTGNRKKSHGVRPPWPKWPTNAVRTLREGIGRCGGDSRGSLRFVLAP